MGEDLRSILTGTAGLGIAAIAAIALTVARERVSQDPVKRRTAVRAAVVAILAQSAHFAEELATGFHERFPAQLGLSPWSVRFFIVFNLTCLVVWALSCRGLAAGRPPAVAALWFLGLAALLNGVAHPLLAIRAEAYFPGLLTSPFVGLAGILLVRRLALATRAR
jgi:hypothetical protein